MQNQTEFIGNNRLLTGMVLGVLTFWLFYQSMFVVVPALQKDLAMPDTSLNAVIGLGSLFSGCFIILMGGLADRFGRVKFTYLGFGLNILACMVLYFSRDVYSFGAGRILQGLSAACIMPATMSLIKNYYHGAERQRAFSFWSIGSFGGSGLSSIVGGALGTYWGWKSIFLLSIAISILGMILIKGTPESQSHETAKKYDYIGLFSCVLGLLALNLLITKGFRWGLGEPMTWVMLLGFVVMATVFFITEKRLQHGAFLDFALFQNRGFNGACLSNFLLNIMVGTLLVNNIYLQKAHGLTAFQAGLRTLGYVALVMVMIRVSEKLLQKWGYKKPMWLGTSMTSVGVLLLSLTMLPPDVYLVLVPFAFAVFGFGLGCYSTPAADCAMVNVPLDKAGVGAGVFKMASALGASFGIATATTIFTLVSTGSGLHTGAQVAFLTMCGFGVLSTLAVWFVVPKVMPEKA
ncbi:MFS transporter [Alysiella filiformis]|uniref:MFS transporter, DHA2 family, multidrug resistance protein n=1 Tax=Alysiella filiformis DSM 16848 TaxID=1120981 RepID=A0A286EE97_9NEIS|nr:MFS transporter [Alysiella filiformis]QMT30945.1 MFS transporter [Alysiella filiformis]UBQ56067.1 MFS transporter [Alysiella filiformis DSM 16848]SOD69189.1 MFS transporter, DHA2 family, multidrug resistance protein [Alysiella filiformis DSM 16848]